MKTKRELLKIYSAYLPYELEIECYTDEEIEKDGNLRSILTGVGKEGLYDNYGNDWDFSVRPYLWSMDMLTKEIEHKGERFDVLKRLRTYYPNTPAFKEYIDGSCDIIIPLLSSKVEYCIVQKLIEWHFNVFEFDESEYIKKSL